MSATWGSRDFIRAFMVEVTFNFGITSHEDFEGNDLTFCGMFDSAEHRKYHHTQLVKCPWPFGGRYKHVKGRCVVHSGKRRHGAMDIQKARVSAYSQDFTKRRILEMRLSRNSRSFTFPARLARSSNKRSWWPVCQTLGTSFHEWRPRLVNGYCSCLSKPPHIAIRQYLRMCPRQCSRFARVFRFLRPFAGNLRSFCAQFATPISS